MRSDEECTFHMGNSFYLQCSKLRRLKISVISICSTRKDVSMVIGCNWKVTEGAFKGCLDRKEVRGTIWGVHSTMDRPADSNTGLFLTFVGLVCAD